MRTTIIALSSVAAMFAAGCSDDAGTAPNPLNTATGLSKLNHIVVLYMENHSFDNLYGKYPGAEGLDSAEQTSMQVDDSGAYYKVLPQPMDTSTTPPTPDMRFPNNLPNAPFKLDDYVKQGDVIPDLVHRYYQEQSQIDGGKMDKFADVSNAKGLVMGYWDTTQLPLATFAQNYTVCDYFFHSAFGGSFMNHIYLISANVAFFPDAPASITAVLDPTGKLMTDGQVTPDGYVVNTSFTVNTPHPAMTDPSQLVPSQTFPTIGDRMDAAKISWKWYSGGWDDAIAGKPDALFQFHHQPFAYFESYADDTPAHQMAKAEHLRDETDFMSDIANGTLPQVSFWKPIGEDNEHPGYSDLATGEKHVMDIIDALKGGPQWKDMAIIVTYDEHGGQWDHVPPPKVDRWGPGSRVPAIVISPYAKTAFVDHTKYETASILATIEHRFTLEPLTDRDAHAADMSNAFDFTKTP